MDKNTVQKVLRSKALKVLKKGPDNRYSWWNKDDNEGFKAILEKPLVGYKKAFIIENQGSDCLAIVKVKIPAGAMVICGMETPSYHEQGGKKVSVIKLRASVAHVLYVKSQTSKRDISVAYGYGNFPYKRHAIVKPKPGFDRRYRTCSSGIHFFLTRKEAEVYDI